MVASSTSTVQLSTTACANTIEFLCQAELSLSGKDVVNMQWHIMLHMMHLEGIMCVHIQAKGQCALKQETYTFHTTRGKCFVYATRPNVLIVKVYRYCLCTDVGERMGMSDGYCR